LPAGFLVVFPVFAEPVILLAFFRIAQDLVGFIDVLELVLGGFVTLGLVRVIFEANARFPDSSVVVSGHRALCSFEVHSYTAALRGTMRMHVLQRMITNFPTCTSPFRLPP
jgi:hypothetical protein